MRNLLLISLAFSFMNYGCGSDAPATAADVPGSLGEACYPNDTCDAELMCVNGICVPADPVNEDAGATDVVAPEDVTADAAKPEDTAGPDTSQDTQVGEDATEDAATEDVVDDAATEDAVQDAATEDIADIQDPTPACGDGKIDDDESCDDGEANSDAWSLEAHCNGTCSGLAPHCGDGICQELGESLANCEADCSPCTSSKQCAAGLSVCDLSNGTCVECSSDSDCQTGNETCVQQTCEPSEWCISDKECNTADMVCHELSGQCVDCVADEDCSGSALCADFACISPDCGNGKVEGDEQCDEGNEEPPPCDYGQLQCTVCDGTCQEVPGATSYCGDSEVDFSQGEECDDGNSFTESCPDPSIPCDVCQAGCTEGPGIPQDTPGGASYTDSIYAELSWTGLDGEPVSTDLDLHFLHPFATGQDVDGDGQLDGWFDQPFDCFWFNNNPNWGSLDPEVDDNPSLNESVNSSSLEAVGLNGPEEGLTYRVGVHYWADNGLGSSAASVRIYLDTELVLEVSDVNLAHFDLWEVAEISWPSGDTTLLTDDSGAYKIIPNYEHPYFFE